MGVIVIAALVDEMRQVHMTTGSLARQLVFKAFNVMKREKGLSLITHGCLTYLILSRARIATVNTGYPTNRHKSGAKSRVNDHQQNYR